MIQSAQTQLQDYLFLGRGQSAIIHGIFLNEYGQQLGNAFTYSVGTTTAVNFATINGAAIPSTASYAIIGIESNKLVAFACGSGFASDLQTNVNNYPYLAHADKPIYFGRGAFDK